MRTNVTLREVNQAGSADCAAIAAALGTAVDTVRKQTIRVYQKLRVSGRLQLLARRWQ